MGFHFNAGWFFVAIAVFLFGLILKAYMERPPKMIEKYANSDNSLVVVMAYWLMTMAALIVVLGILAMMSNYRYRSTYF